METRLHIWRENILLWPTYYRRYFKATGTVLPVKEAKTDEMFGEKALELIKQLQRAGDGPLPPFDVRYFVCKLVPNLEIV